MDLATCKPTCKHGVYRDGHCAIMACRNYVNKCPNHSIVPWEGDDDGNQEAEATGGRSQSR